MKRPNFKKLESSQIKGYHYDADKLTLLLEFKSNKVYSYYPLDKEDIKDFLNAESQGRYFHQHFKSNVELLITKVEFE